MITQEIQKLFVIASAIDPRMSPIDAQTYELKVAGWELALDRTMTFEFARHAVGSHYANSVESVMPANLNQQWAKESKRLQLEDNARQASLEIESARAQRVPMPDYIKEQLESLCKIPPEEVKQLAPDDQQQIADKQRASVEWLKTNG